METVQSQSQQQSELPAAVTKIVKDAQPKFDNFITVSITYTEGGRWHDVQLTFKEYLALLQSGELDKRQVCAVELFDYNCRDEEENSVKMIYDFVLKHTERDPWRMA
jgi:hypothetical protein